MRLTPDEFIYWQHGFFKVNATLLFTWVVMFCLTLISILVTRHIKGEIRISRWQSFLEIIVTSMQKQIAEIGLQQPLLYIGFLGTIFLLIAGSTLGTIFPGFKPPTSSLSTTTALALCVFLAVPIFGIKEQGLWNYLKSYAEPTVIMLPFNIISEFSRTLALAVRLFGNMMSGAMLVAILLTIAPYIFPIMMTALGLLTGMVQSYIFSVLAGVYIAAATMTRQKKQKKKQKST